MQKQNNLLVNHTPIMKILWNFDEKSRFGIPRGEGVAKYRLNPPLGWVELYLWVRGNRVVLLVVSYPIVYSLYPNVSLGSNVVYSLSLVIPLVTT